MLTAVGVLIAAQKGLVNLNIPIKKCLPKFEIHSRFLKDPLKKITLKNLLSHLQFIKKCSVHQKT